MHGRLSQPGTETAEVTAVLSICLRVEAQRNHLYYTADSNDDCQLYGALAAVKNQGLAGNTGGVWAGDA